MVDCLAKLILNSNHGIYTQPYSKSFFKEERMRTLIKVVSISEFVTMALCELFVVELVRTNYNKIFIELLLIIH
jgi:hypothetical protein